MLRSILFPAIVATIPGTLLASTTFAPTLGNGFEIDANWDNSAPGEGNDGTIDGGNTAVLTSDYNVGNSTLTVGANGTAGTFEINSGGVFDTQNGTSGVRVGVGSGALGTVHVNNDGIFRIKGAGADLYLGDLAGGQGFLNVDAGGTLDARKGVEIINGRMFFASGAIYSDGVPKDAFIIGDQGILGFETLGSSVTQIKSDLESLDLSSGSSLQMQLGGAYSLGDSWSIMTGVSTFNGTFGSVIDPNNAANQFAVFYGTGPAAGGEIVVQLVPEPGTLSLLLLPLLAVLRRRR